MSEGRVFLLGCCWSCVLLRLLELLELLGLLGLLELLRLSRGGGGYIFIGVISWW